MKIKVAITDDHPLVINGLYHLLNNCPDMEITGSYMNGAELLRNLPKEQPDVLLLDIHLPDQQGDELTKIISEQYPLVKILVLTNLDNVFYIKNMLRKGAHGYILKTTQEDTLLNAIRTVFNGKKFLEPVLEKRLMQDTLLTRQNNSTIPVLSKREKEVLQHIAANLTSKEIADRLFISKKTVDNHRLNLLLKFGVKNVAALVKKSIQLGLTE